VGLLLDIVNHDSSAIAVGVAKYFLPQSSSDSYCTYRWQWHIRC